MKLKEALQEIGSFVMAAIIVAALLSFFCWLFSLL